MNAIDTPIRHGYSLADLDRLARAAVGISWVCVMDYDDRYDEAWSAIAELLCTIDEPPTARDLKLAGAHAIELRAEDDRHHRGYDRRNPDIGAGGMPGFRRYWTLGSQHAPSFEESLVDRMAFHQIWGTLSGTHQRILAALAAHENHAAAAQATGKYQPTYRVHLRDARRSFRRLWFQHETDPGVWARTYGSNDRNASLVLARRRQRRIGKARAA